MKPLRISIHAEAGDFAENKEVAKRLRETLIIPALQAGRDVIFDFAGVSGATQSFIHALISDPIRKFRDVAYENMYYEHVDNTIKEIIGIVYRYLQESLED
jgi:hypothetical protein